MFKIYDGRDKFFQWDLDRKLIVEDKTIKAVHFCNRTGECSLTSHCYEQDNLWLADVPNVCLQDSYRLRAYAFSEAKYTMEVVCFDVEARTKPDEYAYTEEEINCWQELDERIKALEENPVSEEAMAAAIEAYFAANPIESDIEIVNASGEETIELDKTYEEIMAMVEAGKIVVILYNGQLYYQYSNNPAFRYVGEAETRYIGFNKKTNTFKYGEIILPTFEDVEDTVNNAVADFQTAEQVEAAINAAKPDLTGYALKSEVPSLDGYATEEYVNNAVANAGGSSDCRVMIVKSNNSADSIKLDKTFNNIQTAVDEGKIVIILHKNKYYHLTKKALSLFTFSRTEKTKIENILVYQGMTKTSDDNFITQADVEAAIEAYVGVIENGSY